MTVSATVARVEILRYSGKARGIKAAPRHRHGELVGLPPVSGIDAAHEAPLRCLYPGAIEHGRPLLFQALERRLKVGRLSRCRRGVDRAHVIALEIGTDEAERGERTRNWRADDFGHAEFLGEGGGMHRTGSTKGGEDKFTRVMSTLNRDDLQRFGHGMVDYIDDGGRRGPRLELQRFGQLRAHGALGRPVVDRQIAGEQGAAVEVAQQQIAVGHRWLRTAAPVAAGSGHGPRAIRANAKSAGAVHPGDRAAAGRNLRKVDHRHPDWMAGAVHGAIAARLAADLIFRRRLVLSVANQARLGRGATHVEG